MAATKLLLANQALHKIGARPITTFGETTTVEGRAINSVYDDARDEILSEAPWTFAQRRIALVNITAPSSTPSAWVTATVYTLNTYVLQSGTNYICLVAHTSGVFATDLAAGDWGTCPATIPFTDDRMTVAYTCPSDMVKVNYISYAPATWKVENMLVSAVATAVILSDTLSLKIQYTYRNDAPALYYAKFTKAFVSLLAYELCFEITEATRKAGALYQEYEDKLAKACASDAQQGTPIQSDASEWESARLSGGTSTIIQPGAQTWHPIW